MFTITRYIFKRLFSTFLVFIFSLLGIVWLTQALRFLEVIINHNVGIRSFLSLIIYLIPDLTVTLMPICALIAAILTYQRTAQDHELVAMRSIGCNNFDIAKPFLILGVMASIFMLAMNVYVVPKSFQKFRQNEHKVRNQFSFSMLKPGHFNVFKKTTIYIKKRNKKNNFDGVFLQYENKKDNGAISLVTIMSKSGSLERQKHDIILNLHQGQRQEKDGKGQISILKFVDLSYNLKEITSFIEERRIKPYEKSIMELFEHDSKLDKVANRRLRIEAHQRILLPFMALISILIVICVHQNMNLARYRKRYRSLVALVGGVFAQAVLYLLLNLYTKASIFLPLAYLYVSALIIIGFVRIQQRTISRYGL